MGRTGLSAWVIVGGLALAVLLSAGGRPLPGPAENTGDTEQQLRGSWLREQTDAGVTSRRILTLGPQHVFREQVRVVDAAGGTTEFVHEGHWFYDGTNLKRKYSLFNGQPPSRLNVPFVTFQIQFESRNEFVGIDHVHRNRVRYRRVQPETQP